LGIVTMKELLEAGVHFGHQTRRWDPRMKSYIFTERNGIHIIDLQKTIALLKIAYNAVKELVKQNGIILFVGTKRQARSAIEQEAARCSMPYVSNRWLGGMITNFSTIQKSIMRLKKLERMEVDGSFEFMTKKEVIRLNREKEKLLKNIGGIKDLEALPDMIFIIDPKKEAIAIAEAMKSHIPIVAIVDSNCNPEGIDYPIPGNDDAIRAINLFAAIVASAVIEGQQEAGAAEMAEAAAGTESEGGEEGSTIVSLEEEERARAKREESYITGEGEERLVEGEVLAEPAKDLKAAEKETDVTSKEPGTASKETDSASEEADTASKEPQKASEEPDTGDKPPADAGDARKETDATSKDLKDAEMKTDTSSKEADTVSNEPDLASEVPVTVSKEPDLASEVPVTASKEPDLASEVPVTVSKEPDTADAGAEKPESVPEEAIQEIPEGGTEEAQGGEETAEGTGAEAQEEAEKAEESEKDGDSGKPPAAGKPEPASETASEETGDGDEPGGGETKSEDKEGK